MFVSVINELVSVIYTLVSVIDKLVLAIDTLVSVINTLASVIGAGMCLLNCFIQLYFCLLPFCQFQFHFGLNDDQLLLAMPLKTCPEIEGLVFLDVRYEFQS